MGRPSSPITAEAEHAQSAVKAYLEAHRITQADLAVRANVSASMVGRVLDAKPARAFPALLKLHKYVVSAGVTPMPSEDLGLTRALGALERGDAMATAQILRAIADLLDRRQSRP